MGTMVADADDVRRLALALPHVEEIDSDGFDFRVGGKGFVWSYPEREPGKRRVIRTDIAVLYVGDEAEKQALILGEPRLFFAPPAYDGWPLVMLRLAEVDAERLAELVTDAWRMRAPGELAADLGESLARNDIANAAPAPVTRDQDQVRFVPANEATWEDLAAIFGTTDYPGLCQCQRFKVPGWFWRDTTQEQRMAMLREQTACGNPAAAATSGLVAYLGGEPVGWVAIEPRTAYPKLRTSRLPWAGRDEDKGDHRVWAVTCFAVRKGYRGRGLTYALARATIGYARQRGARALEAYPMITAPGKEITWGEVHVGARQVFEDAGFTQVSRPTTRRVVMRVDFEGPSREHA